MDVLDGFILGGMIITGIASLLLILQIIRWGILGKRVKRSGRKLAKARAKRERRQIKRLIRAEKEERQGVLKISFLLMIVALISGGVSGYSYYYQQTNLSASDLDNLTEGTLYLSNVNEILETLTNDAEASKKEANIRELASHMSSLSVQYADSRAPQEVQFLLNRYYKQVGQLGVNMANETVEHLINDPELVASYLATIKRIDGIAEQIYTFYGISKVS